MQTESLIMAVLGLALVIWALIREQFGGDADEESDHVAAPSGPNPVEVNETINENLNEELTEIEDSAPDPSSDAGVVSHKFNDLVDKLRRRTE